MSKAKSTKLDGDGVWDYPQVSHIARGNRSDCWSVKNTAHLPPWARRACRLAPNGVPRWVRIYDNGGETVDRYTVVYTGRAAPKRAMGRGPTQYPYLGMSGEPFHPQGFGQHGHSDNQPVDTLPPNANRAPGYHWPPAIGRRCHLGKRIEWADLPHDCKRAVWQDYAVIWDIPTPRQFTTAGEPTPEPRRVPAGYSGD